MPVITDKYNKETKKTEKGITDMAIGFNAQYKLGIDTTTLKQVSNEILKRAAEKNSQYNTVSAQSNFVGIRNLDIDLYKGNVDINVARQVAMNNSGFQVTLNQETLSKINYLNSMAAQNVQKSVGGRITVSVNEITLNEQKTPVNTTSRIVSQETAKDKNGSNPFYHGELLMMNGKKQNEDTSDVQKVITTSIFA